MKGKFGLFLAISLTLCIIAGGIGILISVHHSQEEYQEKAEQNANLHSSEIEYQSVQERNAEDSLRQSFGIPSELKSDMDDE